MNAKLVKVSKRLVPLATAILASTLVVNKVKSGLDENSTDVENRITHATAVLLGGLTFVLVAGITEEVIDDLTTEEVEVVEIPNEIK